MSAHQIGNLIFLNLKIYIDYKSSTKFKVLLLSIALSHKFNSSINTRNVVYVAMFISTFYYYFLLLYVVSLIFVGLIVPYNLYWIEM